MLLVRTPRRGWEFPGGQIEEGESVLDGVVREVLEEAGVVADVERLVGVYEQAIAGAAVVVPFDDAAARRFASIRRDRSIRPPDAIQLACASVARVDLFVTNDARLSRKIVPGIHFIQALGTAAI